MPMRCTSRVATRRSASGPAPPRESYLNAAAILAVAAKSGAQAIHPGYGFLSENEAFARSCADAGVVFIGPPPSAIAAMGSKSAAKIIMGNAQRPAGAGLSRRGPGCGHACARSGGDRLPRADQGDGRRRRQGHEDRHARRRVRGGAGVRAARGEGVVRRRPRAARALPARRRGISRSRCSPIRTATRSTCSSAIARCSAGIRRCSRRRPRPGWTPRAARAMGEAAVAAAKAIGYVGAGTVEFIAEQDGTFYFMEMNTRLQVEHPVTEMITGPRPGRVATARRLRRAAAAARRTSSRSTATRSRRGSMPRTPTAASCRRSACLSHWRMPPESRAGSRRYRRARRRRDLAVLRSDARQADRVGRGPRRRVRADERRAGVNAKWSAWRPTSRFWSASSRTRRSPMRASTPDSSRRTATRCFPPPTPTPEAALLAAGVAE